MIDLADNPEEFNEFRKGSEPAFQFFVDKLHSLLYQSIFTQCKDKKLTYHLMFKSFADAWDRRDTFENEGEFIIYLYFSAACQILRLKLDGENQLAAEREWTRSSESTSGGEKEREIFKSETIDTLYVAMKKLPRRRREVMFKIYFEKKSIRQVAQEMNTTEQTVINQRGKALLFLRRKLSGLQFLFLLTGLLFIK
jgi:RNA polymerase sigma factor (sigma-70 family)